MVTTMKEFGELPLEPFLPPPRKILRRGTTELATALLQGDVELSLPQYEQAAWMGLGCSQWGKKGYRPKENAKCVSEPDAQDSLQHQSRRDLYSKLVIEELEEQSCKSKELSRSSKKRKRNEIYPRFRDIIGHHHVKLRLEEVLLPLALPSHIADKILTGIRANLTSIFMYGPPGCGKTELAKALAREAEAAFLPVCPSDILSKFVGESEASMRSIFNKAIEEANQMNSKCAVLFFDEIDALGQGRGGHRTSSMAEGGNDGCSRRVLAELLIQLNRITSMDRGSMTQCHHSDHKPNEEFGSHTDAKCQTHVRVVVVAATNRPEDCDPALLRRFSIRVVVSLPSQHDRRRIIKRFLKGIENSISNKQFNEIAIATNGWSGADLEHLTREAAMAPVRECIRKAALQRHRNAVGHEQTRNCNNHVPETAETNTLSEVRQKTLAHHFRELREVTCQDFQDAIQFWVDNHQSLNRPKPACGRRSPTSVVLTDCGSDDDD